MLLLAFGFCDGGSPEPSEQPAVDPADPEALSAIGYVDGSDPVGETRAPTGITRYQPQRTAPGVNLLTSGHGPVALLMDMKGQILHQWRAEFRDLFPGHPRARQGPPQGRNFWRVARLLPNGDLIAIWELYGIFELDRDSRILWVAAVKAHHDVDVTESGEIYHLEAMRRPIPGLEEVPATDDFIVVRDPNGVEQRRIAISDALRNADWPRLREAFWKRAAERGYGLGARARFDPFHTNALRILTGVETQRLGAPFQAGDALVSMAMLDTIAAIGLADGTTRWWQQGPFGMQHHPRATPDGKLVVFDNFRAEARSSVRIIDPRNGEVTWEYAGTETDPLFSLRSGGAEILPNGNVLIVETDRGRVLELTPDKEVVWEFRSPFRAGTNRDRVASVYSLERLPRARIEWLTR